MRKMIMFFLFSFYLFSLRYSYKNLYYLTWVKDRVNTSGADLALHEYNVFTVSRTCLFFIVFAKM